MKRERKPLKSWQIAVLLLLVAALTAFLTQNDFVQNVVAPGAYYIVRVFVEFLNKLPQLLVWLVFILFGFQLLLGGIVRYIGRILEHRKARKTEPDEELFGPVEKYGRWVAQLNQGAYFRNRLARAIADMTIRTLGKREHIAFHQIDRALRDNVFNLPPTVTEYLQIGLTKVDQEANTLDRLTGRVNAELNTQHQQQLIATVEFLEQELNL